MIAIIAILAAILFPVFARARAKAKQSSCLSNVKQITLAFLMYASDYDDTWPCYVGAEGFGNYTLITDPSLRNQLMPYIKNSQMWQCPSQDPYPTAWAASYVPNRWPAGIGPLSYPAKSVDTTGTDTLMFACARGIPWGIFQMAALDPATGLSVGAPWPATATDYDNTNYGPHADGWNIGWAGGHAKWMKPSSLEYNMWTAAMD